MTASKNGTEDNAIVAVSYRDHHHCFAPDDPKVTFVDRSLRVTPLVRLGQFVFSIVMVHYFLWIIPMVGFVYLTYALGAWPLTIVLLGLYGRSFFNGDQYRSGRPWHAFRQSGLWTLINSYLGVEVVRTQKLEPGKKYVFAMYPHGILILSRVAMYGGVWERLFPGIETRVLGASPMFWSPGSREICLWMSAVDAAKKVAQRVMDKYGLSLMVYPGGSDEIFETDPNSSDTTLIARKGFIKLAVQSGADIVPAFVFGEKWLYHRRPISEAVKRWFMKMMRMPLIIFWGRFFSWLPFTDDKKAFLSVVFGRSIPVQKQADPSDEYIEALWVQYIAQVEGLYEEHKGKFGYPADEKLVIREAKSERRKKKQ